MSEMTEPNAAALADEFPELDPRNYDEADVMRLHEWSLLAHEALRAKSPASPGEDGAVAWMIEFKEEGEPFRHVHTHNAIGDYRKLDPDAISTPLFAAPPQAEQAKERVKERAAWLDTQEFHELCMDYRASHSLAAGAAYERLQDYIGWQINFAELPVEPRTERGDLEDERELREQQNRELNGRIDNLLLDVKAARSEGHAAGFAEAKSLAAQEVLEWGSKLLAPGTIGPLMQAIRALQPKAGG